LAREAHILDVVEIKSGNSKEMEIICKSFNFCCETEEVDSIIYCIRKSFERNFPGIPKRLMFKLNVEPQSRLEPIPPEGIFHYYYLIRKERRKFINVFGFE
jgi:hypothetical protein